MTRVLSIDFDFFVKCDGLLVDDIPYFRGEYWKKRIQDSKIPLETVIPFLGPSFESFVNTFDLHKVPFLDCHESHVAILSLLPKEHRDLVIVNVDAHHDLGYTHVDRNPHEFREPHCGNWGALLLKLGRLQHWTQVFPDWRKKGCREKRDFDSLRVVARDEHRVILDERSLREIRGFTPDILFICRSAPWVPPIYDEKFKELCQLFAKRGRFRVPEEHDFNFPRGVE